MLYSDLKFPKKVGRPFFYTNFVATLDGKVAVKKPGYFPIGSKTDYQTLVQLRSYADCLIHGKNLAGEFGEITLQSLNKISFKKLRRKLGKQENLPYLILTKHIGSLPKSLGANVIHPPGRIFGLAKYLYSKGYKNILVEGGQKLMGSFLKENLIDEFFLTIAPKIFGSGKDTLTLVEGVLFPPTKIKRLKLISFKQIHNEIYLRYRTI